MKPKKAFGQNFLTSGKAIFEIIKSGELKAGEIVLEVGPGKGALTKELLENRVNVIAIEKDKDLIPILKGKFEKEISEKKLTLILSDILDLNLEEFINTELKKRKKSSYKLIANIPYYITGAIIEKFLSCKTKPEKIVLLVQKEVAERIVAKDKKESILSLAVKLYGDPKITYRVSAGSFFPKPKVDSAILSINIKQEEVYKHLEKKYLEIIKAAFSHKRKIMLNNLKEVFPDINWLYIFEKLKLGEKTRAEDLDMETFLKITKQILK